MSREAQAPTTLDGAALRAAIATAGRWLEQHAEALNALNVFPVPDGDTGLNMSLTLSSATEYLQALRSDALPEVAEAMARGALMGARGNSGVILAQILRGMARELAHQPCADSQCLARALAEGATAAYAALANPVEGTILTVARAAAAGAREAVRGNVVDVLDAAHRRARAAVAETPELLPVLKQASVVDAGGEGYRVFLEGLLMHMRGEALPDAPAAVTTWADLSSLHQDEGDFFGYCTEVLFQGSGLDLEAVRDRVSELGGSVLVVGDSEMLKVHVHTLRPGAVLDLATDLGELVKVKIDNMQLQHREFAQSASRAGTAPVIEPGVGLVAVVTGAGLRSIFESLGAVVVPGGQTMNPSVEEIAQAITATGRAEVIVLPNNRNIILAAEQTLPMVAGQRAAVVPTQNVAQGVAAALALNPEADAESNVASLLEATERTRCIEITRATRAASLEGLQVKEGEFIALLDDRPVSAGPSSAEALRGALDELPAGSYELATIYVGSEGTVEEAERLGEAIRERTGAEVEAADGGQPHYPYIISVE